MTNGVTIVLPVVALVCHRTSCLIASLAWASRPLRSHVILIFLVVASDMIFTRNVDSRRYSAAGPRDRRGERAPRDTGREMLNDFI
ncbi:hypothetical protein EVAR_53283_1 [Eumeta japonica]|uniref:Uncharacterized protein n=1 Tax=Eumeta variegata TaxID=151549 RepID=A0A4C1YZR0_EUMVA|nr:hypothetical protein EVAR_53283_1 [Eumeta japonica]